MTIAPNISEINKNLAYCYSWWAKVQYVQELPKTILHNHRYLRDILPPDKRVEICLEMARQGIQPLTIEMADELLSAILDSSVSYRQSSLWEKISDTMFIEMLSYGSLVIRHKNFESELLRRAAFFGRIPLDNISQDVVLRCFAWPSLPRHQKWEIIASLLLNKEELDIETEQNILDLFERSNSTDREYFATLIPAWSLISTPLLATLSNPAKITALLRHVSLENSKNDQRCFDILVEVISLTISVEMPELLLRLPEWLLQHKSILGLASLLSSTDQALFAWHLRTSSVHDTIWPWLTPEAKLMSIYLFAKQGLTLLSGSEIRQEPHKLVRCLLTLLWAKTNQSMKQKAFEKAHQLLEQYVIEQAWDQEEINGIQTVLPKCSPGIVHFCEARRHRHGGINQPRTAFCPRLSTHQCVLYSPDIKQPSWTSYSGARLFPEVRLDWKNWSLMELLRDVDVIPVLPGLEDPNTYVQKMAGWVNRLMEIRERLRCTKCRRIMKPNVKYAKFLAKFSMTIASCPHGIGHDQNIYLNECWGCREIIDSREGKHRIEGYYLCIHCGCGPRDSATYWPGMICPKCGAKPMAETYRSVTQGTANRHITCRLCKHTITLKRSSY
jgi:hypothetical protein